MKNKRLTKLEKYLMKDILERVHECMEIDEHHYAITMSGETKPGDVIYSDAGNFVMAMNKSDYNRLSNIINKL